MKLFDEISFDFNGKKVTPVFERDPKFFWG